MNSPGTTISNIVSRGQRTVESLLGATLLPKARVTREVKARDEVSLTLRCSAGGSYLLSPGPASEGDPVHSGRWPARGQPRPASQDRHSRSQEGELAHLILPSSLFFVCLCFPAWPSMCCLATALWQTQSIIKGRLRLGEEEPQWSGRGEPSSLVGNSNAVLDESASPQGCPAEEPRGLAPAGRSFPRTWSA